jgi:3-oxoacyl-[acyl-carrier-protein] synthase-3
LGKSIINAAITGMHYCIPPEIVTNSDLAAKFGKKPIEQLEKVVGVKERRVGGNVLEMSYYVCKHLLASRGIPPEQIEVLVLVTQTGNYRLPSNACVLHGMLGLESHCPAFDIALGCSGFPYGLLVAGKLLPKYRGSKALVVCADAITRFLDPDRRGLVFIHGDGACATLLEQSPYAEIRLVVGTNGKLAETIRAGNGQPPNFVEMAGPTVAWFVTREVPGIIRLAVNEMGRHPDNADLVITHQANRELIMGIYDSLGTQKDKQFLFLEPVGNTASASSPMALCQAWRQGRVAGGSQTLLAAFGNGLGWGIAWIEWPCGMFPPVSGPVELTELRGMYPQTIDLRAIWAEMATKKATGG